MATSPLRQRWICDDAEFSGIVATLGAAAGLIASYPEAFEEDLEKLVS